MRDAKPDTSPRVEYRGTGFKVGLALILVTAGLLLIVAVQNAAAVTVQFLGWEFELPLFAVVLGALLAGVVLDELIGLVVRRQRRARLSERAELRRLRSDRRTQKRTPETEEPATPASPGQEPQPEQDDKTR